MSVSGSTGSAVTALVHTVSRATPQQAGLRARRVGLPRAGWRPSRGGAVACLPKRPARIEQPPVHAVELVGREACAKQHCAIERGICESAPPLATDTWAAPRHCDSFWIRPNPNLLRRKEKNGA